MDTEEGNETIDYAMGRFNRTFIYWGVKVGTKWRKYMRMKI